MGLFSPKPIYKYKMLEKYKVDIEQENEEFRRTDSHHRLARYKLIGETPLYHIYSFFDGDNYLLRQEKANPKKVVFFGNAKTNMCIYHNKLFAIDRMNNTSRTHHPLYCTDIVTGEISELSVLSDKGCYFAMHLHCQDLVESMSIKDDVLILEVTRYKENSHSDEEFKYRVCICYKDGKFTVVSA